MAKIAVDFDGTIVEHKYPDIGREIPFATATLRMLIKEQHQLILWTVREGQLLKDALDWCHERGVDFWAVNRDFPEENLENNNYTRKIKVDYFIDDRNIGGLPEWGQIYQMIHDNKSYADILKESLGHEEEEKKNWLNRLNTWLGKI